MVREHLPFFTKNGDKSIRNGEFRNDKLYNGTHDLLMHNGDKFKIVYTNGVEGKKTRVKD